MLTIAKLFGASPFALLQTHMEKTASCVSKLPTFISALVSQNRQEALAIAEEISSLEHEADLAKNDIRNHLAQSFFLPIDQASLLDILFLQDALADQAEKIAQRGLMRKLEVFGRIEEDLIAFCNKTIESFWLARKVIKEMQDLLESSFGGLEAQKVKGMVEQIAFCEYETSKMKNDLLSRLYNEADAMAYPAFHLWISLIEEIGELATLSEELGNRVRMLLKLGA